MKPESKYDIEIFPTADALCDAAAKFIIDTAHKAILVHDRFAISLSGGHTPEKLYALLSKPPYRDEIDWNKTFVFWGDERCVPATDSRNNAKMARTLLLDRIDIASKNINPIDTDLPPEKAAWEYENTVKNFFGTEPPCFDLILLGLGENGHTASLFPETSILFQHDRLVSEVYVEEQKMYRVSMTERLINQAHNIIFLVEGKPKAEILNTVINGTYLPNQFPAQLIKPLNGNLYWFVDKAAASLLSGKHF